MWTINKRSVCIFAFLFSLLFNITQAKFLISAESLAPILSLMVFLSAGLLIYTQRPATKAVMYFYFLPVSFLFFGMVINFVKNVIDSSTVSPNVALAFPFFYGLTLSYYIGRDQDCLETIVKLYVWILSFFSILAIVDVGLVLSGLVPLTLMGDGAQYAHGVFAFYGLIEDGELYPRMYGVFAEPGHLAMYLIPVLVYQFLTSNWLLMTVNLIVLLASVSLGGYLAVLLTASVLYLSSVRRRPRFGHVMLFLVSLATVPFIIPFLGDYYFAKGNSASLRQETVAAFFLNFSDMLLEYPLGYPFFTDFAQMAAEEKYFVSTNFTPFNIYLQGGFISLIGYLGVILLAIICSLKHHRTDPLVMRVFSFSVPAFLLFTVQRTTPFETYLFPFLIAPFLVRFLTRNFKHV